METVYWLCAASSLVATWWNIHHRRACFYIWLGTNAVWAYASFTHALPAKGWLHVAYGVLAVVGLLRWRVLPQTPCGHCGAVPSAPPG